MPVVMKNMINNTIVHSIINHIFHKYRTIVQGLHTFP